MKVHTFQEMISEAVLRGQEREKLAAEEAQPTSETEEAKKEKEKEKEAETHSSPGSVSSETVNKIASSLDAIIARPDLVAWEEIPKLAEEGQLAGAGLGPGALKVLAANTPGGQSDVVGQAKKQMPSTPGPDASALHPPTTINTNMDTPAGSGKDMGEMQELEAVKSAALRIAGVVKQAEDVQTGLVGGAEPSPGVASGEATGAPKPSATVKQEALVSSIDAAINATKRDTKAVPKADLAPILSEPALSSATDKVLDEALDHTREAGTKIASADEAREHLRSLFSAGDDASPEIRKQRAALHQVLAGGA